MNVEYPTDIRLLWDAMRKTIDLTSRACCSNGLSGWRQSAFALRRMKVCFRKAQQSKRSRKKGAQVLVEKAHRLFLKQARIYLEKSQKSVEQLETDVAPNLGPYQWSALQKNLLNIANFHEHAIRQIDQTTRRVLHGEIIPPEEKVYSVFEPDVEWISKGKAGVPLELGLKVCVVEDQHQFILHHRVMQYEQDVDIAVAMMKDVKDKFSHFNGCSFDKGFHSPSNQKTLPTIIEHVVLPKKGKLSREDKYREHDSTFKADRRQHSAVESAINALEQHGLDRCLDRGIEGFKRYVGLAILSRNLQRIGSMLTVQEREALKSSLSPPIAA